MSSSIKPLNSLTSSSFTSRKIETGKERRPSEEGKKGGVGGKEKKKRFWKGFILEKFHRLKSILRSNYSTNINLNKIPSFYVSQIIESISSKKNFKNFADHDEFYWNSFRCDSRIKQINK